MPSLDRFSTAGRDRGPMKTTLIALVAALALAASTPGAHAISNGVADGDAHPNVGLLASGDNRSGKCTGFYAGPHKNGSGQGVFLTAGRCVADIAARGISPEDLWVTFESAFSIDPEDEFKVTAASWHRGASVPYALDDRFGLRRSNLRDVGVIVLAEQPAGVEPVDLPTAGFLDDSTATRFDNVGYGVVPTRTGRFDFTFPSERLLSTSRLQSLTPAYLNLLGNSALEGIGGSCFADTGGPKFVHGTNTAVAIQSGGDARCMAHGFSQRLDVPDVRTFLAGYLDLP
jgi:hypothetical protein